MVSREACKITALVQIHFVQRKQVNETNAVSRNFQQISVLNIFSKCLRAMLIAHPWSEQFAH